MAKTPIEAPRRNMYLVRPDQLTIVGLDTEDQEGEHPLWDAGIFEEIDPALTSNIMLRGVDLPISIRKVTLSDNDERYEVVDGRTRVRAARAAADAYAQRWGEELFIPAIYLNGDDDQLFEKMVTANLFRKVTSILDKAKYAAAMLSRNQPEEIVAVKLGVDAITIRHWISLLEAEPEVRDAVDAGQVGASAAIKIAKLPKDAQKEALAELLADGTPVTVDRTRRAVNKAAGRNDIGVTSRKVLKRLRDLVDGPDEGKGDEDSEYRRGFVEALNLSLGDGGKTSAVARRWLEKAAKKPTKEKKPKEKKEKKPRAKAPKTTKPRRKKK